MRLFRFGDLVPCYTPPIMLINLGPPEKFDEPEGGFSEIPDWHREILEEQLARYHANGFVGRPWEEFQQELYKWMEEELGIRVEQELTNS